MGVVDIPQRIQKYLEARGLPPHILEHNKITWDGERIVIPIFDPQGIWLFNKYRRDPDVTFGPKYTYDKGSTAQLYGADKLLDAKRVIICEGEFDSLVLEANGFAAVCSTGGAGTFKQEWFELLKDRELFICFDHDAAGEAGVARITRLHPDVKWIPLPHEVGEHGDVTDYFVKLKRTAKNFSVLMAVAVPLRLPAEEPDPPTTKRKRAASGEKTERLKTAKEVPLDRILKFNGQKFARCPFHNDSTPSLHKFGPNKFKCFGCGARGDAIDLVMRMKNISLPEAVDYLLTL